MKIISVVGARPNFIKVSPLINQIKLYNKESKEQISHILVHTGQHYDDKMSHVFFNILQIPRPQINLNIGSGTHAEQVGKTMISFEKILQEEKPDWVIVFGDVNATIACSIAAKKLHIKICHIEAGIRSFDDKMPEEINRLVTDRISDLLLTPDIIASNNLINEGIDKEKVKFVGNIMIDTLMSNKSLAKSLKLVDIINDNLSENQKIPNLSSLKKFALVTLHRPSNVDSRENLINIIRFFQNHVLNEMTIIWPMHPRTKKQLIKFDLWEKILNETRIIILDPVDYHAMLKLNMISIIMITDSGGLQEECTVLGTPCLTLRSNTERPITLEKNGGLSILVGNKLENIIKGFNKLMKMKRTSVFPKFWDGKTAKRCLIEILKY